MTINQKEIIGILDKVQQSIQSGEVPVSEVPMKDLMTLLEATLGSNFWKGIGATAQNCFDNMPGICIQLLDHCRKQEDAQGFVRALEVIKNQYRCIYAVMSKDELDKRTKNYKILAIKMGNAYAALQHWLHRAEQQQVLADTYKEMEEKKGVVYTCILGNNKTLHQPEYINVHWDYICFTDKKEKWGTKEGVWEYRGIALKEGESDAATVYYRYKIKPHEILSEYDYSIWISPQIMIIGELERFCRIYGEGYSLVGFPAYVQDNLYDAVHTTLNADDENIELRRTLFHYREEGFPEHYGLINTNLLFRNHSDEEVSKVMDIWWEEAKRCSQLREFGFSYAAWKQNLKFALCDLFAEWNPYIKNMELDLDIGE